MPDVAVVVPAVSVADVVVAVVVAAVVVAAGQLSSSHRPKKVIGEEDPESLTRMKLGSSISLSCDGNKLVQLFYNCFLTGSGAIIEFKDK